MHAKIHWYYRVLRMTRFCVHTVATFCTMNPCRCVPSLCSVARLASVVTSWCGVSLTCLQKCVNDNVSHTNGAGFLKHVPVSAYGETILPKVYKFTQNCAASHRRFCYPSTLTLAKQLQQLGSTERCCPFENEPIYWHSWLRRDAHTHLE